MSATTATAAATTTAATTTAATITAAAAGAATTITTTAPTSVTATTTTAATSTPAASTTTGSPPPPTEDFVHDGKNKFQVQCIHCDSRILCEQTAAYLKQQMQLPRPDSAEEILETLDEFWKVTSLLTFENIGMTKPSKSGVRYLTCCDCERGPLGIFDQPSDTAFLALGRVKNHQSEPK